MDVDYSRVVLRKIEYSIHSVSQTKFAFVNLIFFKSWQEMRSSDTYNFTIRVNAAPSN